MRLWHYKLIDVLPKRQLLGQWKEVCALSTMVTNPKFAEHFLVKRIKECGGPRDLYFYARLVRDELTKRGYKPSEKVFQKIEDQIGGDFPLACCLFPGWHDERYLLQNYYNLEEKVDLGLIPIDEFDQVVLRVADINEGKF